MTGRAHRLGICRKVRKVSVNKLHAGCQEDLP